MDHRDAFRRVGLSNDGRAINHYLQQILMTVEYSPEIGALQSGHGRRQLARELKGLLEAGYAEQQSVASADPADPDAIVRLGRPDPVKYDAGRGLGRRVQPYADDDANSGSS